LSRLIDGRPDDPGRVVAQRVTRLMAPAMVLANAAGVAVVFALIAWVLPGPELEDRDRLIVINLAAAALYVALVCVVAVTHEYRRWGRISAWLHADREATEKERRDTLRVPLHMLRVSGGGWLIGAVIFFALNAAWSWTLAVEIGVTTVLGGVTTGAAAYLDAERVMRAASARALAERMPDRPVAPGVRARALLAWALGSGVPLAGVCAVAIVSLAGEDLGEDELAVAALVLAGVAVATGLLITWQAANAIADPVRSVRDAMARVRKGDFDARVPVFDGSDLGLLQAGFNAMNAGLAEREELRDLFGRHVGADVARAALERGIELGGEELEVAVLFVDLVGSTQMAASRPPHEVVARLNAFFSVVVEVVEAHGGWVNKFEGDAALAVFGAPLPLDDAAGCALAAARTMARRLGADGVEAGIGVSAGRAVAGNVGTETRFEYTVIGDPVNEAARLCELAKLEDARVLAAGCALERARGEEAARWREGEPVTLRGRDEETVPAYPAR
jgi:adenylate cyclase